MDVVPVDGTAWVFNRDREVAQSLSGAEFDLSYPGFVATIDPFRPNRVYVSHYDDDAISAIDVPNRTIHWTTGTPARPFEPLVV